MPRLGQGDGQTYCQVCKSSVKLNNVKHGEALNVSEVCQHDYDEWDWTEVRFRL